MQTIHRESIISQLIHIPEIIAIIKYKYSMFFQGSKRISKEIGKDLDFCYKILNNVSRSFSIVICQLPKDLSIDILVFYLVLRALDTVEDDIEAFNGNLGKKIDCLANFYKNFDNINQVGKKYEKNLLENYQKVGNVFKTLKKESQDVIQNITKKMSEGMIIFLNTKIKTKHEYSLYCYYVAGLVGEGLTKLFVINKYESKKFEENILSNDFVSSAHNLGGLDKSMGLFLQKTNIIRDFLEDIQDNKIWWPEEIWKKYTADIKEFCNPNNTIIARNCLNDMILDAMELVPDVLTYLNQIKDPKIFKFCAIPQVMAIATLNKCYDNPDIFTGIVKIRKGLAVRMINESVNIKNINKWFGYFSSEMSSRIRSEDPNSLKMKEICNNIQTNLSYSKYNEKIINIISMILAGIVLKIIL